MAETLDDDALRHLIDLRHLITDGDKSWNKFQLVGLSERDGYVYLVAYKENWEFSEIGIFRGSPLLPNSWKLISRFSTSRFFKCLDTVLCRTAFSNNFNQIGITVRGKSYHAPNVQIIYCFILFDLNSSQWKCRPFLLEHYSTYFEYSLAHTCIGWIFYPDCLTDLLYAVFLFSLDPSDDCISLRLQFRVKPNRRLQLFVTNDNIYCVCSEHLDRFMYKIHLNRDGCPRDRYTVDSGGDHLLLPQGLNFARKFMNNVPIFKALTCTRTSANERCSNNAHMSVDHRFCPIYTFIFDSDAKSCRVEKITKFLDAAALASSSVNNYANDKFMVYGMVDGVLTKSKRFAIFDGLRVNQDVPTLYLESVFFKLPTLKELCSLTLVKALCQKTNHVVQLRNGAGTLSVDTWSGGPSEQVYEQLGLNMATLNFGQMEP